MKHIFYCVFLIFFSIMLSVQIRAQITITKNDVDANVLNTTRTTYGFSDTLTVNLGSASSSSQSFDFSNLPKGDSTNRDTSIINYVPSSGQWDADSFPGANACGTATLLQQSPPFTITYSLYLYYSTENDGVYFFGDVTRVQISPTPPPPLSPDSTSLSYNKPKGLQIPLPLTLGAQRTVTDTLYNADHSLKVSTRMYDADGFGSVTFPDGRTLQTIRMVEDKTDLKYQGGVFKSRKRTRQIHFLALDFTQLTFDVDTNFTSGNTFSITGSTLASGYQFDVKGTAVGVQEHSTGIPEAFNLLQNYPNPFNPSTLISFELPVSSYATLKVYDMLGREVATLVDQRLSAGNYQATFDASKLASGMYLYRLSAGSFVKSMKLLIVK